MRKNNPLGFAHLILLSEGIACHSAHRERVAGIVFGCQRAERGSRPKGRALRAAFTARFGRESVGTTGGGPISLKKFRPFFRKARRDCSSGATGQRFFGEGSDCLEGEAPGERFPLLLGSAGATLSSWRRRWSHGQRWGEHPPCN